MTTRPPVRRQDTTEVQGDAEPPPAYSAVAETVGEQTLALGPSRPFQPAPLAPPVHPSRIQQQQQQQQYASPSSPPPSSSSSNLAPPMFPFWNGASLSPQQTGFNPNDYQQPQQQQSYYSPPSHPPQNQYQPPPPQQQQQYQAPVSPPPPNPTPSASTSTVPKPYAPTTVATAGQPLLNKGKLLVFPTGQSVCFKCLNTGYKNNDPSHPCRGCWKSFGKTYNPAILFAPNSPGTNSNTTNLQKPLRTFASPSRPPTTTNNGYPGSTMRPVPGGGGGGQNFHPLVYNPQPLIVHPGDARIGGRLCDYCRGAGSISSGFSFFGDTEICRACRGSGRLF